MKKLFILALTVAAFNVASAQEKILIFTSNQHQYGNTEISTSNHFEEIVMAYDVFVKAGYSVDIVSPEGGAIPIGYINTSNPIQKKYLYDSDFMNVLEHTLKPENVSPAKYAAVYYSGGGAAMFGVPSNQAIQNLATEIYANGGIVSAVCHGTAGLVYLKEKNGQSLYKNKKITGFPDAFEKKDMPYYATFPFSIDEAIKNGGGKFVYSEKGSDNFYIVDDRVITGQDPSATASVAKEIVAYLASKNKSMSKNVSVESATSSELDKINAVLMDYIEGTANGQPDRVRRAFHEDLKLYFIKNDTLEVWDGKGYVDKIKEGEKNTRQGKIVSVDYENNAAMAKIEILVPGWKVFTDYLLLLKISGTWKIIHKSFTSRPVSDK